MANWQNYEPKMSGFALVTNGNREDRCAYEIGHIATGRQRVFHKFYAQIDLSDGSTVVGVDPYNLRAAVLDLNSTLTRKGMVLVVAGTDPDWCETGLSHNSGWGYFSDATEASHIMSQPPLGHRDSENDEFVDRLVKEAVDGMFPQG